MATDQTTLHPPHSRTERSRAAGRAPDRPPDEPLPLAYRIERQRLRARVRALERELAVRERRRAAIVEQYERLLEERAADDVDNDGQEDDGAMRLLGSLVR